jgi:hypothetical protein
MSAQPDTDRSLNADNKPVTGSMTTAAAATNAAPAMVALTTTATPDPTAGAGDTKPAPDLSSLTREQLEAKVKSLSENVALANNESEFFRQQWQELKLRDEALGVDALTVDQQKLEDKLVQSVKELYQSEMKRREAVLVLDKLLGSTEQLLQTAPNYLPKTRSDYEEATRAAKDYLAGHEAAAIPMGVSLSEGQICDVNDQLNAVVINLGKSQGVKEGMTFNVYRDNAQLGTMKIILARDLVSAGLVENLKADTHLKAGDRVAVDVK